MSGTITGGCLCGAVRYEARGEPRFAGFCFCNDCRRQSGGGYIGFMGFDASAIMITGPVLTHSHKLSDGRVADRNHCAACWSLVYGGIVGENRQPHDLCRLTRRSIAVQADHRNLRERESAVGDCPRGRSGVRLDAARLIFLKMLY